MKNILLLFLFCCYSISFAQNNDAIPEDKVKVNNTIELGFSVEQVNAILGTPEEIKDYYSEIDDEYWKEYNYSGNLFYFYDNKLTDFELKNIKLFFYDTGLRVGKGISTLATYFPLSYLERGVSGGNGFATINIVMPDGNIADWFITIQYSPDTNIITSISTASY